MTAFFVLRRSSSQDNARRLARAKEMLGRQGFSDIRPISHRHADILVCGKTEYSSDNLYVAENGDFLVFAGTLAVNGETGPKALRRYLERFDPDGATGGLVPGDLVQGHYCVLVGRAEELFIAFDEPGYFRLFTDRDRSAFSTAFLPLLASLDRRTVNPHAVYEYVHTEAVFGGRTPVEEIEWLSPDSVVRINETATVTRRPRRLVPGERPGSFQDHVDRTVENLRRYFAALAAAFGDRFGSALSGGYDSRLVVALLRAQGLTPRLHVYGTGSSPDVVVAKRIAAQEGFKLEHVDKAGLPKVSLGDFPAIVEKNFLFLDGFPHDGIVDNGADLATRLERYDDGRVMLAGSTGEIFRNNSHLPNRSFTPRGFVQAFFARGIDPRLCTERFSENVYYDRLIEAMTDASGLGGSRLKRSDIEYLMPGFWWRYWVAGNMSVENRFGYFIMPFGDQAVIKDAVGIPVKYKYYGGRFEAAVIRAIDPRLAAYPSAYGHDFSGDPPMSRVLKDFSSILRPSAVRRVSHRLKNRISPDRTEPPYYFGRDYLARIIDPQFPVMRQFFRVDQVRNWRQYNRLCTLEYLYRSMGVDPAL